MIFPAERTKNERKGGTTISDGGDFADMFGIDIRRIAGTAVRGADLGRRVWMLGGGAGV